MTMFFYNVDGDNFDAENNDDIFMFYCFIFFSINSAGERIKLLNKISVDLDKGESELCI